MKKARLLFVSLSILSAHIAFGQTEGSIIFDLLTGGKQSPNGKSWKMTSGPHSSGVGPLGDTRGLYYNYPEGLTGATWTEGALQNTFTFRYDSLYIPQNQTVTANFLYANHYFGKNQPIYGDLALEDPNHKTAPFVFKQDTGASYSTNYRIEILENSYIGYFEMRNKYQIIKISADSLFLCNTYDDVNVFANEADDKQMRCFRYVNVPTVIASLEPEPFEGKELLLPYPNPCQDKVSFSPSVVLYVLYDALGVEQLRGKGQAADVSHLHAGNYVIHVIDKEGNASHFPLFKE